MPQLSWSEVRERAIRFSRRWSGATSERADKQTFGHLSKLLLLDCGNPEGNGLKR
jgi:hypothetical protein